MSVVLVRLDDRLIHGQVVVGWGHALGPHRIALVDDEIAANDWEAELYRAAVPEGLDVEFATVEQAAGRFEDWHESAERTIVLVGDVESLCRLCDCTPGVREINLGGLHQAGQRAQRLPYLFLTDDELVQLRELEARGVTIVAQDLPNASAVSLRDIR